MKNSVKVAFSLIALGMLVLILLDIGSSGVRKTEASSLANNSTYNAMRVNKNGSYDISSNDELVVEAIKDIVMSKSTDSDIKVQVLGVDYENGLLDLNIIETIHHVNGEETIAEERRTVVIE